jgi:hypothetical protein
MLAVIGLLYSFGLILSQRRSLQAAADAASLAGTWQVLSELGSDNRCDANVNSAIAKYATTNGATTIAAVYVDASNATLSTVGSLGACAPTGQFPLGARGVKVTVSNSVPTILPGFVRSLQVLVQDSATAMVRPSVAPPSAPVVPLAVSVGAYSAHATYDLFANPPSGNSWTTLDLSSAGAPAFAPSSVEAQYWSDGQHLGAWLLAQPATVNLLDAAYYDSVAAGLQDNIRRQARAADVGGHAYGLFTVPIYDTATAGSVHVVGFAQLKILASDISSTSAKGTFVPYPAAAFGSPGVPVPDLYGATLVGLSS